MDDPSAVPSYKGIVNHDPEDGWWLGGGHGFDQEPKLPGDSGRGDSERVSPE